MKSILEKLYKVKAIYVLKKHLDRQTRFDIINHYGENEFKHNGYINLTKPHSNTSSLRTPKYALSSYYDKGTHHITSIFFTKEERYKNYAYGDLGKDIEDKLLIFEFSKELSTMKIYIVVGENAKNSFDYIFPMFIEGAFKEDIDKLCLTSV